MKARIKETGEWITVDTCTDGFYDVETHNVYAPDELDFTPAFDWQAFRREAAMKMLPVTATMKITKDSATVRMISKEGAARLAIEYADELIRQLKQE